MIKTTEELKTQAREKGITRWKIHNCSMCGYPCGYIINGDIVQYDSGCNCVQGELQERSWEDLAETYNRNQPENNPQIKQEYLDEVNEVWQFEQPTKV